MDAPTQEMIALGIVAIVVAWAAWQRLTRKPGAGCNDCKSNPDNAAPENTNAEKIIRFMPRSGKSPKA